MVYHDWNGFAVNPATLAEPQSAASPMLALELPMHPSRQLTPERLAQLFRQAEFGLLHYQADLFRDMEEQDGHLFAEMHKRKMAVTGLVWNLVPPRDASARERKATAALEERIRHAWNKGGPLFDALDAIGHGYSCIELEWRNGADGWWPELHHRPPSWFATPQADRSTLHLRDPSAPGGVPLQPFGWITHIHKSRSGYPATSGLHRTLAWPYLWKLYSARDLAEFLEIYGMPVRLGKYPPTAGADERVALMKAVMSIGHNAGGIIPQGMEIDFSQTVVSGGADGFKLMIDWCEAVQSKAILGGTLTSQTGSNGNRALGQVHNEVRLDIRNNDAVQLAGTLSRDYVYPIALLNGLFEPGRCPQFVFDTLEPEDLTLYADAIPKLAAVGVQVPEGHIHDKLKIPVPEGGERVLGGDAGRVGLQSATPPQAAATTATAASTFTPRQMAVENLADAALAAAPQPVDAGAVRTAVLAATGPEDLEARLALVLKDADLSEFRRVLEQALFAADVLGYAHAHAG